MQVATKKRIGILRGGAGKNYASSLQKGGELISHITDNLGNKYEVSDIFVDKDHIWHFKGLPVSPSDLVSRVDLVWNVSHPSWANILDSLSIPHISASHFSSALDNSREMLREHMAKIGVKIPRVIVSPKNAKEVFEKFGSPWIVRNYNQARVVKTFDELAEIINTSDDLIVEEFIAGKVATIHSVPMFREEDVYIFPLGNTFGDFSGEEKDKLNSLVKELHEHIGAKHYLRSDFVLNPRGRVYLLNIEFVPDLKPESHFSQVCESVSAEPHQVVEHILQGVL